MLKIEETLHAVHAEAIAEKQKREAERKLQEEASGTSSSSSLSTSSATQLRSSEIEEEKTLEPFARINSVAPDSPAEEAGLLQGDRIVAFGTVNAKTTNLFPSLSQHVQSRENKPIVVKVLRGESTELHSLVVVPRKGWGGLGTLGCYIVPA
ncbi:putative 26S proteasome regulatory subunit [Entomortierella chlamydospora]|nr:putative 26S proteasome regulatory subunit [Entomortierella chlamydospora]